MPLLRTQVSVAVADIRLRTKWDAQGQWSVLDAEAESAGGGYGDGGNSGGGGGGGSESQLTKKGPRQRRGKFQKSDDEEEEELLLAPFDINQTHPQVSRALGGREEKIEQCPVYLAAIITQA